MKIAAVVVLALVALAAPAHGEESDGASAPTASSPPPPGDPWVPGSKMAGFTPVSDVTDHSRIDLDIKDIESLIGSSAWTPAWVVYASGKNSPSGDGGLRTLQSFSTKFRDKASMQSEPMAKLAFDFWGTYEFGDALVTAALVGTDHERFGKYKTGSLARKADARKQVIKKGIKFSVVWLYALHEMESALAKYKAGNFDPATGAPHALDEVWAFYAGSLEGSDASLRRGSQESSKIKKPTGYGPYIAGEKNAVKFGTYGYETGAAGRSRVTLELLYQLTAMQQYLHKSGYDDVLQDIAKCVRAQFKVPLIQGCLSYAHKSSFGEWVDEDKLPTMKAEAWAYCAPVLPWLNEADPAAAQRVESQVTLTSDERPDWDVVKKAFNTKNLNKMGLMCEDIGFLGGGGYLYDKYQTFPAYTSAEKKKCKDNMADIKANAYADSSKCAAIKFPKEVVVQ